jgi:tripartite-type tricarboxylate transporter receptor subunit TctC
MPERAVLSFVAAFALLLASAAAVGAQDYPAKPVVIITSTAAGGGPDVIARTVADRLTELWPATRVCREPARIARGNCDSRAHTREI